MFVEGKNLGYYYPPRSTVEQLKQSNTAFNELFQKCNSEFGISIEDTANAGKGLIAKRAFKPGDLIFKEKALAAVVLDDNKYCPNCTTHLNGAKHKCDKCSTEHYCSEACKHEAYNVYHKYACNKAIETGNKSKNMLQDLYNEVKASKSSSSFTHLLAARLALMTLSHEKNPCFTFELPEFAFKHVHYPTMAVNIFLKGTELLDKCLELHQNRT